MFVTLIVRVTLTMQPLLYEGEMLESILSILTDILFIFLVLAFVLPSFTRLLFVLRFPLVVNLYNCLCFVIRSSNVCLISRAIASFSRSVPKHFSWNWCAHSLPVLSLEVVLENSNTSAFGITLRTLFALSSISSTVLRLFCNKVRSFGFNYNCF